MDIVESVGELDDRPHSADVPHTRVRSAPSHATNAVLCNVDPESDPEESSLFNYHLEISPQMGLTPDMIFLLAQIMTSVELVDSEMGGDTLTPSQENLHDIVAGTRPIMIISDGNTDETDVRVEETENLATLQLQRYFVMAFDSDSPSVTAVHDRNQSSVRSNIVPNRISDPRRFNLRGAALTGAFTDDSVGGAFLL